METGTTIHERLYKWGESLQDLGYRGLDNGAWIDGIC